MPAWERCGSRVAVFRRGDCCGSECPTAWDIACPSMGSASTLSLPGPQLQAGGNLWFSGLTSSGNGLQGPVVRSHGLVLLTVQGPSCLRVLRAPWCTYRKHALWDWLLACPRSCFHSSESPHPVTASVSDHLVSHGEHQADQGKPNIRAKAAGKASVDKDVPPES